MFLSVGFWLLDLPHQTVKLFSWCYHKFKESRKEKKRPFIDTYAFDLGYHMAYSLTMFAIALVFSILVPYVPVFAMIFFMFKYYVDKYNLSFVYNTEFQGMGIIKSRVVPLAIFNVIVYQMINVGFFASKADKNGTKYLYAGIFIVIIELIAIATFYFTNKRYRYQKHKQMRDN